MDYNDLQNSKQIWILLIIIFLILGLIGGYYYAKSTQEETICPPCPTTSSNSDTSPVPATSPESDLTINEQDLINKEVKTYTNDKYKFELKFSNKNWHNYKIIEAEPFDDYAVANFQVLVPTKDKNWETNEKGYWHAFSISIYTPSNWIEQQSDAMYDLIYLDKTNEYVAGYLIGTESPEDYSNGINEAINVINTFKFIK